MIDERIKERLEYLRGECRAQRISYGEIAELQSLAQYIDAGDVELLELAGVPEHADADDHEMCRIVVCMDFDVTDPAEAYKILRQVMADACDREKRLEWESSDEWFDADGAVFPEPAVSEIRSRVLEAEPQDVGTMPQSPFAIQEIPVLTYQVREDSDGSVEGNGQVLIETAREGVTPQVVLYLQDKGQDINDSAARIWIERTEKGWAVVMHSPADIDDPIFTVEIRKDQWRVEDMGGSPLVTVDPQAYPHRFHLGE